MTLKWGRRISALFERRGGPDLRARLEAMPNEEYQRLLRVPPAELVERVTGADPSPELRELVTALAPDELAAAVRDLGGHDLGLLIDAFAQVDPHRPTVVFAYTIKGRGLPTEGHPANHSALLTPEQMRALAASCGIGVEDRWAAPTPESAAGRLALERGRALRRTTLEVGDPAPVPVELGRPFRKPISTQAALGRILADLSRDAPETAARVVTCSPDVASSTNLGGWINKRGVWAARERQDWFSDDPDRLLRWAEADTGQHIELGIAEVNLVCLAAELGTTWSRWGRPLIPIATLYDPFVARALEPWSYGIYSGGQSILVGTPSGVTLAPEGGAHQSITTPSIGLEQPGCVAWEPAFPQDLEWCLLHAMGRIGRPDGTSSYFRLSTRPLDPALAGLPEEPALLARRRRQVIAGGYRIGSPHADGDEVTLVGVGAIMPEVIDAARTLERLGRRAGVICLTSPDLVFRAFQEGPDSGILGELLPAAHPAPLVTVLDGHPHTLAFLAGVRGDRTRNLGVVDFGQSSALAEAQALHGIDAHAIVDAALTLVGA